MSLHLGILRSRLRDAMRPIRRFALDQHGIVAVEWVAITGAVVVGSFFVVWYLTNSLNTPASSISGNLADCETWASTNSASISGCQ